MTGHFVFDELLVFVLHFDIDCTFKRLLQRFHIFDCRTFARAIQRGQYKEWNIADIILSHLNTYHQYLCDHSVNEFLEMVKQDKEDCERLNQLRLKKEKKRREKEQFERLEKFNFLQAFLLTFSLIDTTKTDRDIMISHSDCVDNRGIRTK